MNRGAPLQRRTPLKRTPIKRGSGKALRRSWMRSGGPIKYRRPRRIDQEAVFAPYVLWLHGEGARCMVCGTEINIQGAHVARARGTSLKHGFAYDMVRLCTVRGKRLGCHEQFDRRRGRFDGWSDDQRDEASRGWRLLHWEAFGAWVGIETARRGVDPEWAAKLVACEEAIAAARGPRLELDPERPVKARGGE